MGSRIFFILSKWFGLLPIPFVSRPEFLRYVSRFQQRISAAWTRFFLDLLVESPMCLLLRICCLVGFLWASVVGMFHFLHRRDCHLVPFDGNLLSWGGCIFSK